MDNEKVSFTNDRGLKLAGVLDGEGEKGIVVCSHFTGFKEYKHYYKLAKALAKEGFLVLRFDFSDCIGESQGSCETMSLTHQIRDVVSAMDFLEERGVKKIGLMGHSLGGTTAIVTASEDKRVKALVTAASLAKLDWDTLFKKKNEEWKKQGFITFPSWKKGEIKINYGFYKDLAQNDATELIKKVSAPLLVIQAGNDELVPIKNGQGIYDNANDPKEINVIENANHMFSKPEQEEEMVNLSVKWFKKWL